MDLLGIDIGGSGIKGAPVDLTAGVLKTERLHIPTPQPATPAAVADSVAAIANHFNWTGPIGCGLPSAVTSGVVQTAANIDQSWIGINAGQMFSEATRCPTTVINDADAAGLAEMRFGIGAGRSGTVIMITIGTGLGSAIFQDGVLLPNTELGHLILDNGEIAEKYASAAARNKEGLSFERWAKRFDHYLKYLQELFWPDLFIVGGGLSNKHDKFLPLLTVNTEVKPAHLYNDAGIVGAALAAHRPV